MRIFAHQNIRHMKAYIAENKDRFLTELMDFLSIPSISANPDFKDEVVRCAEWLKTKMLESGCDQVTLFPTDGHPIVYGEKIIDPKLPTVLVYGHYDVQPADPLELWHSEPFSPIVKATELHPEGAIFARGACDDKGQVYMHVKALEWMTKNDALPCNIKMMIEGEEEVGSSNLSKFIVAHKDMLKADVILVSDTSIIANDTPSITVGLRGLSYVEVEVTGPNRDLHSGVYGGAVANPINVLSKMIASLHDENNRITIPGFYDKVIEVSDAERENMARAPFHLETYKKDLQIDEIYGELGYSTNERTSIRPTLDVNGIWGGYIGEGAKTVLPAKAFAKISMRLVPNQNWEEITTLFQRHFEALAPLGVQVKVTPHHGGQGTVVPSDFAAFKAAERAMKETFGIEPIPVRSGGSIPIIAEFETVLGLKSVLMGFGLNSDLIHSPNEHFGVFNFLKGIETIPLFFKFFSQITVTNTR
jgi:acetylornithine deacetylase/succinyl-diaminopimelate desuccinylase-like protein